LKEHYKIYIRAEMLDETETKPPQEQRLLVHINPANMVNREQVLWCRTCQDVHDEDLCPTTMMEGGTSSEDPNNL